MTGVRRLGINSKPLRSASKLISMCSGGWDFCLRGRGMGHQFMLSRLGENIDLHLQRRIEFDGDRN